MEHPDLWVRGARTDGYAARCGPGRARCGWRGPAGEGPNTSHAARVKTAQANIAKLQRGWLPGRSAPSVPRTTDELVGSAAQHPQHHAAAGSVPVGRPHDAKRARVGHEACTASAAEAAAAEVLASSGGSSRRSTHRAPWGVAPATPRANLCVISSSSSSGSS